MSDVRTPVSSHDDSTYTTYMHVLVLLTFPMLGDGG